VFRYFLLIGVDELGKNIVVFELDDFSIAFQRKGPLFWIDLGAVKLVGEHDLAELELPAFVEVLLGELADKYLIFKDN
jgi:mRNA degradation ribonuclease J1/J2